MKARLAIVGVGRIAEVYRRALAEREDFQLVGLCDVAPLPREDVATFSSIEALLTSTPCDVVVVATPTALHRATALPVLERGVSILLEKPLATTADDVDALFSAAEKSGALLQSAYHMARGAEVDAAAELLAGEAAAFGVITGWEAEFQDPLFVNGTLHPRARSVFGSWFDSGINALSVLARFIDLGRLASPTLMSQHEPEGAVADIATRAIFEHGEIRTDWTHDSEAKWTALYFGKSQRRVTMHHDSELLTIETDGTSATRHCRRRADRMTDHYHGVLDDLADALRTRRTNTPVSRALHRLLFARAESDCIPEPSVP
jgi:predicted dehydrogenase